MALKAGGHWVDGPLIPVFQVILGQGRSLQGIPAVQHQGVSVLFHLGGQIHRSEFSGQLEA